MDYVVGSVASLISGNVTPNRPKLVRRALTPMKHQPSPNVTPKSEFVEDRSIFLSPTLQKKKAIVKKSPKRIFENPDLDVTSENEGNILISPKADKVKKHLKDELEAKVSPKSPKNKNNRLIEMLEDKSEAGNDTPKKKKHKFISSDNVGEIQNNVTPKKTKNNSEAKVTADTIEENIVISPKKSKKRLSVQIDQNVQTESDEASPKKKSKKRKQSEGSEIENVPEFSEVPENKNSKKKDKKRKKKNKQTNEEPQTDHVKTAKKNKNKSIVNPNAVTDKDTDSEHESDNEIESENEEANNEMLDTGPNDESSDEEENTTPKKAEKVEKVPASEDEVQRTLFVGNVPFTKKCKKEIKKIFSKYGTIETVRIRTVPVKDPRFTPKLALIKNELHSDRSTVNVYVKFKEASSVDQALAENNTVLDGHHLRVTRSSSSGAAHDPRRAVFVGNLPFGLEDDALRDRFQACGDIHSVRIIRDRKTNAGKGFGYINFASKDGVELALNLSEEDLTIKNRILRVKRCQPTQPASNTGPRGGQTPNQGGTGFVRRNEGQGGMKQGGKSHGKFQGKGDFRGNRKEEGAYRRIMNKRKGQEGGDGPPDKRGKFVSQPQREKKVRKEFVGMTAEKRKKHTFNKGQKKKKILSEILANK